MARKNLTLTFFIFLASLSLNAQTGKQVTPEPAKTNYKFLDDISVETAVVNTSNTEKTATVPAVKSELLLASKNSSATIESAESLQFKYSLLMNVEVELLKNINLLKIIDEWYGVRYQYGGGSKQGIDCSALMQIFFTSAYGISLPRTARMQYDMSKKISRTELKEGDLVFFNTRGGVSHVGMYLQNNKFVHASVRGVAISDLFDPYYANRLIGVGRIVPELANGTLVAASFKP